MEKRSRTRVLWRALVRPWWRSFAARVNAFDFEEGWLIILFAAVIGTGSGYAIVVFYAAVAAMRNLFALVGGLLGLSAGAVWFAFFTAPLGLLLARWILKKLDPVFLRGDMVPSLILAAAKRAGEVPVLRTAGKLVVAVITIGSGGSLGVEGPVALAGGTIGSGLGQLFQFRANRVKVLLACGAAAGISAAFNAPIAGVMFALEIVLGAFTVTALSPVVVSSVLGAVVARAYLGSHPAFNVPVNFSLGSPLELGFYLILGLTGGVLAMSFTRGFHLSRAFLEKLPHQALLAPVVTGLLLGAAGWWNPNLLGAGRHGIQLVLFGEVAGLTALLLGLAKIFTSGLTMAAGGAGGVFTPSLFVGASYGSFFGLTLQKLFPALAIAPQAYALVGMAAVVAGATFAPLTAILIVFEMTDDYGLILPLMLVCIVSYMVARKLHPESIYTAELKRTGEHISHGVDRSVLESVRVAECYNRNPDVMVEDARLLEVLPKIRDSRQTEFPVVNRDLQLVGMISYQELARATTDRQLVDVLIVADLTLEEVETVTPEDTLLEAMRKMGVRDLDYVPVVEAPGSGRLVGLVGRADLMDTYQTHVLLGQA